MRGYISQRWTRFINAFFLEGGVFYLIFLVLLLPMFWYALRTKFALIDDYNSWYFLRLIDSPSDFINIPGKLLFSENIRFRPVFHFYNFLTWLFLGLNYSLHHAVRIGLKLLTGWFFWRIIRTWTPPQKKAIHLPAFVFWALFLFFPNNPEARLAPQETLLAVALAWLLWGLTRLVWRHQGDLFASRLLYVELLFAFVLFIGAKETAVAQAAVIILCLIWFSWRIPGRLFGVLPFVAVPIYPVLRSLTIYNENLYSTSSFSITQLLRNLVFMLRRLTFYDAQPLLFFIFVSAAGWLIWLSFHRFRAFKAAKEYRQFVFSPCDRPEDYRLVLGSLLGLLFMAAGLMASITYRIELRYMYIPMILWILIVALGTELPPGSPLKLRSWITRTIIALGFLFVFTNYYNFIYQFAAQYYTRANEARMLKDVRIRLERGDTIYVVLETEFQAKIQDYFKYFLPYFEKVEFPTIHFVDSTQLYTGGIYYLTTRSHPLSGHELQRKYLVSAPSRALVFFKQISQVFNFGQKPFYEVDDGVFTIGEVNWYLYQNTLPLAQILAGTRVEIFEQQTVLKGSNPPSEKIFPLAEKLIPGHTYAALVDYTSDSSAHTDFQIGQDYADGPHYVGLVYLPAQLQSQRLPVVFGSIQLDDRPAYLRLVNLSPHGDTIVTRIELLDLGERP